MSHPDLAADLPFYANGTLDVVRHAEIEAELATCGDCARELAEIEALRGALLDAEGASVRETGAESRLHDVWSRIDAEPLRAARPSWRSVRLSAFDRLSPQARVGSALAAALLIAIGFAEFDHLGRPSVAPQGVAMVARTDEMQVATDSRNAASAPEEAPAAGVAGAMQANAPEPALKAAVAVTEPRQLARDGSIDLIVADVAGTIARVTSTVDVSGGVVTTLGDDVPSSAGAPHTAQMTLRVPDAHFEGTMTTLSRLGTVTSRAVKTEDLTGAIVDTDARLRNLRREEADLLRIMDRSGKIADVLDVERELAATREQIETLTGEAKSMRARVSDATIELTLTDARVAVPVHASAGLQLTNRWNEALADVQNFTIHQLGRLFELLVFSPYLIAAGVAIVLLYRRLRGATRPGA